MSRDNAGQLLLDADRLAYSLGGVAHVVVEPDRTFSFSLMNLCGKANPYSGAIGISVPGSGIVRRYIKGPVHASQAEVSNEIHNFIEDFVSNRSAIIGWEWQELQEEQSRRLRKKASQSDLREYSKLLEAELQSKEETILNLKAQISALEDQSYAAIQVGDGVISEDLAAQIGAELYPGEFSDRIRLITSFVSGLSNSSIDSRTTELARRLFDATSFSGRAVVLQNELKAAVRDGGRSSSNIERVLTRIGYVISSDGKHKKATPSDRLFCVENVTLPNTPSDGRAGLNLVSDICGALSIRDLR